MGGSVGLAVLATIAIDRTHSLLGAAHGTAGTSAAAALTSGYARAFTLDAILGLCACAVAFIVPSLGPRRSAESHSTESREEQIGEAVVDGEEGALPTFDPASAAGTISPEPA
jgi:hypothetical protein